MFCFWICKLGLAKINPGLILTETKTEAETKTETETETETETDLLGIYNTFCTLLQICLVFTTLSAHCSRFSWYLQHFLLIVTYTVFFVIHYELPVQSSLPKSSPSSLAPDSLGIYNTFCTLLQIFLVFTTLSASSPKLGIASPRLFQNPDSLCIYNTFFTLLQILFVFSTLSAHCSRFSWYLQHFLQVVQSCE